MKKQILIILFTTICLFGLVGCASSEPTVQATPNPETTPTPKAKPLYTAQINHPTLYGASHAVFSAVFDDLKDIGPNTSIGFLLASKDGETQLDGTLIDGTCYTAYTGLSPKTDYTLNLWVDIDGEPYILDNPLSFNTPAYQLTDTNIDSFIQDILADEEIDETNRVLLETQACLMLMDFETDRLGTFGSLTQSNLTRIEYSLWSEDTFVDIDHIHAEPTAETLALLKDMLSANPNIKEADIVHPFIPTPYALTSYAVLNEEGGSLDIETYIMEQIRNDADIAAIYAEYPYDQTTPEFQTLYSDIINSDMNEESKTTKLNGYAAKNKALFSYKTNEWMIRISKPQERLVLIADSENEVTINTMTAYAYLLIDAYRDTGKIYKTSTTYRDCDLQRYFYRQMTDEIVEATRNGSWHLRRQIYSYVPGFSNHQYGVAIDFYPRNDFDGTKLHQYIVENGEKYGIYNYYLEAWHWAYLGKTF